MASLVQPIRRAPHESVWGVQEPGWGKLASKTNGIREIHADFGISHFNVQKKFISASDKSGLWPFQKQTWQLQSMRQGRTKKAFTNSPKGWLSDERLPGSLELNHPTWEKRNSNELCNTDF